MPSFQPCNKQSKHLRCNQADSCRDIFMDVVIEEQIQLSRCLLETSLGNMDT